MIQDKRGLIWLASEEGLFRFDGLNYKRYTLQDSTLCHVTALAIRQRSGLWVGMQEGNIFFIDEQNQVWSWIPEEGLPDQPITAMLEDHKGRLWFSTYGEGLYVYDEDRLFNFNVQDGLVENQIYSMALDNLGQVWIATDNGISVCRFENRKKFIRNIGISQGLLDEIVYSFAADSSGMWVGFHSHGFCHFNAELDTVDFVVPSWSHGPVRAIYPNLNEKTWVGTERGIFFCDQASTRTNNGHFQIVAAFKDKSCDQIMADQEGNLWLMIDQNNIYCGSPMIEVFPHEEGDIQAILQDQQGAVWLGTQNGLFELRDGKIAGNRWPDENIISLYEDKYERIWIGTFGQGVICWDPQNDDFSRLRERHGMVNGSVLSIDGYGDDLWLATLGGIVQIYNQRQFPSTGRINYTNLTNLEGLSGKFFYKVFVDNSGNVWFGTDGQGVIRMIDGKVTNLLLEDSFPARTVYTIAQDQEDNIWLGTGGDGVYIYRDGTYEHLDQSKGLRSQTISSIAIDAPEEVLLV
ncbi:MAG: hypothetical protein HKN76_00960, partial [Saprospiraceae bacterium]|nr:hypothetical protein [Saprospiraceae bacterium]